METKGGGKGTWGLSGLTRRLEHRTPPVQPPNFTRERLEAKVSMLFLMEQVCHFIVLAGGDMEKVPLGIQALLTPIFPPLFS